MCRRPDNMCVSAKLYQMLLHCLCSAADLFVNISLVIFLGYSAFNLHQLESQFKVALLWDADVEASSNSTTTPGTCADWEGNNSTLGFGSDLASEAAAITSAEIKAAPITGFASGGILPSLMFDVIDHFATLYQVRFGSNDLVHAAVKTHRAHGRGILITITHGGSIRGQVGVEQVQSGFFLVSAQGSEQSARWVFVTTVLQSNAKDV